MCCAGGGLSPGVVVFEYLNLGQLARLFMSDKTLCGVIFADC